MCEIVVYWFSLDMTPDQFWNYSPTGELYYVFVGFQTAEEEIKEWYEAND